MDLCENPRNEKNEKFHNRCKIKNQNICKKNFEEFSSSTSLHGIQYLGDSSRSSFEKIWWLIMITISLSICGIFIQKTWKKWNDTPVIVTFAESATPIWQIPFPAITICTTSRIMQTTYNMSELKYKSNWTDWKEDKKFEIQSLSHICRHIKGENRNFTDESTIEFLKKISKPENFLCISLWNRKKNLCANTMYPITTQNGFCVTFNGLDSTEIFRENAFQYNESNMKMENRVLSQGWSLESQYQVNLPKKMSYPRRSSSSDMNSGLALTMISNKNDIDYHCGGMNHGYQILLHSPANFPMMSQGYFISPLKQLSIVSIKPSMITTSEGLKSYDPEWRKCFFSHERRLKYFKIYTMKNCEWECLSNYTFQSCGCVSYWMPREHSMPICDYGKLQCTRNAKSNLEELELRYEYAKAVGHTKKIEKLGTIRKQCNCMPSCTSIFYDAEVTQTKQSFKEFTSVHGKNFSELDDYILSSMKFYFKQSQFITSKRSELYGISDFIGNCGGILGLFLGFSILSAVEIFYFLSIRPICAIRNNIWSKKNKKPSD